MEHDTVSVTLVFPGDRVAQFTVSYATHGTEGYKLTGTKGENFELLYTDFLGEIEVNPSYHWLGTSIAYKAKVGEKEESKTFPEVDQFAGETEYFSDCILNDIYPEPNGEEGLMDVRVICAVKKALESGKPVKLEAIQRSTKRIAKDQIREMKQSSKPTSFIGRDSEPPSK